MSLASNSSMGLNSPDQCDYAPSPRTCSHALTRANQLRVQALLRQLLSIEQRQHISGSSSTATSSKSREPVNRLNTLRVLRKTLREIEFNLSWMTQVDLLETIDRLLREENEFAVGDDDRTDWRLIHDATQLLIETLPRLQHQLDDQQTISQLFSSVVQNLGHKRSEVRRASLLLLNSFMNEQPEHFKLLLSLFIDYGLANHRNPEAQRGAILSLPLLMTEQLVEGKDMLPLIKCLSELLVEANEQLFYSLYLALQRLNLTLGDRLFNSYLRQCDPNATLLYRQAASRNNSLAASSIGADDEDEQQAMPSRRKSVTQSSPQPQQQQQQQQRRSSMATAGVSSGSPAAGHPAQESPKQVTFENDDNNNNDVESEPSRANSSASTSVSQNGEATGARPVQQQVARREDQLESPSSVSPQSDFGEEEARLTAEQQVASYRPPLDHTSSVSSTCSSEANLVNPAHYMSRDALSGRPLANFDLIHHIDHSATGLAINDFGPVSCSPTMEYGPGAENELMFGIFPKHLISAASFGQRYLDRVEALQEIMCIIRESPINHLAILMTYFDSFLEQFLARLMEPGIDYKIELIAIDIIETIVIKTKISTMQYARPMISLLLKTLNDSRSIFRDNTVRVIHKMMAYLPPQHVIDAIFEHKHSKCALVREEAVNRVTAAVLEYDRNEFNLTKLCYHVLPMLADQHANVRLASLECIATLAHALGPERIGSLLTAAEAVQTGCDYDGLLDAINARLLRHTLPRCNPDGSIRYVIKPFLSVANANYHQEHQAADVRWVLEAPSSHQHQHQHEHPTHGQQLMAQHQQEAHHQHHRLGVYSPPDVAQRRRSSVNLGHHLIGLDGELVKLQQQHHHHHQGQQPAAGRRKSNGGGGQQTQRQHQAAASGNGNQFCGGNEPAEQVASSHNSRKLGNRNKLQHQPSAAAALGGAGDNNDNNDNETPAGETRVSSLEGSNSNAKFDDELDNCNPRQQTQQRRQSSLARATALNDPMNNQVEADSGNNEARYEDNKMSERPTQTPGQVRTSGGSGSKPRRRSSVRDAQRKSSSGQQQQQQPSTARRQQPIGVGSLRRSNSQDSSSSSTTDTNRVLFQYYLGKFKESLMVDTGQGSIAYSVLPSDSAIYTDSAQAYASGQHQSRFQQTSFDYDTDSVGRIPDSSFTPKKQKSLSSVGRRMSAGQQESGMEAPPPKPDADSELDRRRSSGKSHSNSSVSSKSQDAPQQPPKSRSYEHESSDSESPLTVMEAPPPQQTPKRNSNQEASEQSEPSSQRRKSIGSESQANTRRQSLVESQSHEEAERESDRRQSQSKRGLVRQGGSEVHPTETEMSQEQQQQVPEVRIRNEEEAREDEQRRRSSGRDAVERQSTTEGVSSIHSSSQEDSQGGAGDTTRQSRRSGQRNKSQSKRQQQRQHQDDEAADREVRRRASRSQPPPTGRSSTHTPVSGHRKSNQVGDVNQMPYTTDNHYDQLPKANKARAISVSPSVASGVNIRHILENVAEVEGPFQDSNLALRVAMDALDGPSWSTKVEGILALIRLATFNQPLVAAHMHEIMVKLASETSNLRSTVARSAIFALGDFSAKLKRLVEPEMDIMVSALLAKSSENTAFIRDDIRKAFSQMVENLTGWRLANALMVHGSNHKNVHVRRMASQFVASLVERMGAAKCLVGARDISAQLLPAAAKFAQDSSPHTRYYGRSILARIMQHGAFERLMRKNLTPNLYRSTLGVIESVKRRGPGDPPTE